jgi:hypothetical protein
LHGVDSIKLNMPIAALEAADEGRWRVFVAGATEEVNVGAVDVIRKRWPHIVIVGRHHGFAGPEAIQAAIAETHPQVVLLALGSPRQELLAARIVEQALAARDAGDHSGALARFLQAGQIQMRPGLRMSIAQEEQALGRTLASCESASQCVVDVQADLASPESARVMQGCAALVASTCASLGRVHVQVAQPAPADLRVEVQGRAVALALGEALRAPEALPLAEWLPLVEGLPLGLNLPICRTS